MTNRPLQHQTIHHKIVLLIFILKLMILTYTSLPSCVLLVFPWQSSHGDHPTAPIPRRPSPGNHPTAIIPWRPSHGDHPPATIPRRPFRGDHLTATIPRRPSHGDHPKATIPRRPSHKRSTITGIQVIIPTQSHLPDTKPIRRSQSKVTWKITNCYPLQD